MIIQGINTTASPLVYSSITIGAGATVTIPSNVLTAFSTDPSVFSDITAGKLNLSDTVKIYLGSNALQLFENYAKIVGNANIVSINEKLTSQVNGTQSALDVGINVAGVQIDPRAATPGTLTDHSSSATVTSSQIMATNSSRKYILIQSLNGVIWINFGVAATNASPSIRIASNSVFTMEGSFISTEQINVRSDTATAVTYTAKEG